MKHLLNEFGNAAALILITLFFAAGQVSIWVQLFGYFPPPNAWIPTIIFFVIFRSPKEGLGLTAILAAAASTLSASPFLLFVGTNLGVFAIAHLAKNRIFWVGPTYMMLISGLASLGFSILYVILSFAWEASYIVDFQFFEMILRSLLTALIGMPAYYLFSFIDSKTHKALPTEAGSLLYE